MRIVRLVFFLTLVLLVIFSYGFVDFNLPVSIPLGFNRTVYDARLGSAVLYGTLIIVLFGVYGYFLLKAYAKKVIFSTVKNTMFITVALLLLSYPAFSNDIFNYIATAKVAFQYGENPYIVMPLELSHEPMLSYLHAANKTALYGPSWILLTAVPHFAGMGNLIQTLILFKAFIALFYLLTSYMIWRLSNKNVLSLVIFALNPLVLAESLVSSHNDIVMMFFALLGMYLIKKRMAILAVVSLLISIGVKFATVALVPVFIYVWYQQRRGKKVVWRHLWLFSGLCMTAVFALSPLREEMYPWYFQWIIVYIALVPQYVWLVVGMMGLSLGLSLRFAPYVYSRNWAGPTQWLKPIITALPLIISLISLFGYRFMIKNKQMRSR